MCLLSLYRLVYTNFSTSYILSFSQILDIYRPFCYICIHYSIQISLMNPTPADQVPNPKEMIRVSVSEAARLFGVNSQTIRRAIASQEVTYVVVSGRYKLNFESLVKWSQQHTTTRNKLAVRGIGQYVEKWKIKNPLYSPNPKSLKGKKKDQEANLKDNNTPD